MKQYDTTLRKRIEKAVEEVGWNKPTFEELLIKVIEVLKRRKEVRRDERV